jgi:hypothetical protein
MTMSESTSPGVSLDSGAASDVQILDASEHKAMIAVAAYYIAEKRGFAAGGEEDDWFSAEREIEKVIKVPV